MLSHHASDAHVFEAVAQPLLVSALLGRDCALVLCGHRDSGCHQLAGFASLARGRPRSSSGGAVPAEGSLVARCVLHVLPAGCCCVRARLTCGARRSCIGWLFHQQQVGSGLRVSAQLTEVGAYGSRDLFQRSNSSAGEAATPISAVLCPETPTTDPKVRRGGWAWRAAWQQGWQR